MFSIALKITSVGVVCKFQESICTEDEECGEGSSEICKCN